MKRNVQQEGWGEVVGEGEMEEVEGELGRGRGGRDKEEEETVEEGDQEIR